MCIALLHSQHKLIFGPLKKYRILNECQIFHYFEINLLIVEIIYVFISLKEETMNENEVTTLGTNMADTKNLKKLDEMEAKHAPSFQKLCSYLSHS